MKKCRVLSLDGGGLRGLITARLLQKISHEIGDDWLNKVDVIAGTSTGGILALGLAAGKSPEEIAELYVEHGADIFKRKCKKLTKYDIYDRLLRARYSNQYLTDFLEKTFKDKKLGELNKRVIIPTFDVDSGSTAEKNTKRKEKGRDRTWKPKIFHNFPGDDSDGEARVADVALYTSAAPSYFPFADSYIDGGVYANNPAMIALAQVISQHHNDNIDFSDVCLLSLGTGVYPQLINKKNQKWGLWGWKSDLINIMMDGTVDIAHYQLKQLLRDSYYRLQPKLVSEIKMDDATKISEMETFVNKQCKKSIKSVASWLAKKEEKGEW